MCIWQSTYAKGFEPRRPRHSLQSLPDIPRWALSTYVRRCCSSCYSFRPNPFTSNRLSARGPSWLDRALRLVIFGSEE